METEEIERESSTEENIILVNDDSSIVIDENTTFVDEDGNPITVNQSIQGKNIVLVVKKCDANDVTEKNSSENSQEKTSIDQEETSIMTNNFLSELQNMEGDAIIEHDGTSTKVQNEQDKNSSKDTRSSTIKLLTLPEPKETSFTDKSHVTIIDKVSRRKYFFEGTPQNVNPDIQEVKEMDRLTCPYCLKKYMVFKSVRRHLEYTHKIKWVMGPVINNHCKCVECNLSFKLIKHLRNHLSSKHNMKMDMEELSFPSMEAFCRWKNEVESKELMRFQNPRGRYKIKDGYKVIYRCHRSGVYEEKAKGARKRRLKVSGSLKMGIDCTAEITCTVLSNTVKAVYCPYHYGHGKDMTFRQLTEVEQNALQENLSNGIPYENILGDNHEDTTKFQVSVIKQKDMKIINKAFKSEEYCNMSDAESVNHWVKLCCQRDDPPVLYYKQEENDILLVTMTEFQKSILLSSDKQILCLDNTHRQDGRRFYLTSLMALDELKVAFPVAFCISNKVDKSVMKRFLLSIRDSTGPLSCSIFMSDRESFYREAWQEVMEDNSKWIWSMWHVDSRFKMRMNNLPILIAKRSDFYKKLRLILECPNKSMFETMFKNLTTDLCEDPFMKKVAKFISQKYANSKEFWAYCYHKDVKLSSITQFDSLHRTLKYCSREGKKTRLDKFIFVIMKLMRFKMLDRLTNTLDDEKICLAVESINTQHRLGFEIPSDCISSLGDKIWLIRSDEEQGNIYVVREFDSCPSFCSLKCSECNICVHMFSCSCIHNMVFADLCQHIHAVVWKFLTPHFSPLPSPAHDNYLEMDDTEGPATPSQPLDLFDSVLKMTHDVFKQVRSNKSILSESTLRAIKDHLNECMYMSSGEMLKDSQLKNKNVTDSQVSPNNVLRKNCQVYSNNVHLHTNNWLNTNVLNIAPRNFIQLNQFKTMFPNT